MLSDVTSNISLICTPDLPGSLGTGCNAPTNSEPIIIPTTEELATNLLNGPWKTFNSTMCYMSVDSPANFTIVEKQNRFDKKAPFEIESFDPRFSLIVNCGDGFLSPVTAEDIDLLIINTLESDDLLVEDTNMTEWKLDNETTGSFVFGSTNFENKNTYAHERLLTMPNGRETIINYMTFAKDFDIPQMQELQKRMFESIRFYP